MTTRSWTAQKKLTNTNNTSKRKYYYLFMQTTVILHSLCRQLWYYTLGYLIICEIYLATCAKKGQSGDRTNCDHVNTQIATMSTHMTLIMIQGKRARVRARGMHCRAPVCCRAPTPLRAHATARPQENEFQSNHKRNKLNPTTEHSGILRSNKFSGGWWLEWDSESYRSRKS